jgi:perosamine synthetase
MNFIPLASPDINADDISAVTNVLKSGMLVQGEKVLEFEQKIGSYLNATHSIAVSNGTATMHLSLIAMGIGKGDEVIVPAFSYVATANVVELVGATPVFVDIDLDTFNIDESKIESAITAKTKAIIPVHEFGLACNIEKVMLIAKKHHLVVIEDAACALGAKQNNKFVGTFGDFGSFSFHPRKAISSGEGGMILTNNGAYAKRLRTLRNHGIEIIDEVMEFVEPGYNYRMTDFQAALVSSQFDRFKKILEYKNKLATAYFTTINNPKIKLPKTPSDRNHTWQTFHLILDESLNRNEVISILKSKQIGSNYGAQCIPEQKYYQEKYKLNSKDLFPNSFIAYKQGIAIPIYEKLTIDSITYIADILNQI